MLTPSLAAVLGPDVVVTSVVPRTGGQLSTVHEVRLADAEPLIVKQYADEWCWKQAKEVHVYSVLAEHNVGPAPRVVHVDLERAATVLTLVFLPALYVIWFRVREPAADTAAKPAMPAV